MDDIRTCTSNTKFYEDNMNMCKIKSENPLDIASKIVEELKKKGESISFAESCTAGNVSRYLGGVAGASSVFRGSVVSYATEIKCRILGVNEHTIQTYGVVSEETAIEMARGALALLNTTWAGAVTGYAGPGGGDERAGIGTICFAIARHSGTIQSYRAHFEGTRNDVVDKATHFLLSRLRELI